MDVATRTFIRLALPPALAPPYPKLPRAMSPGPHAASPRRSESWAVRWGMQLKLFNDSAAFLITLPPSEARMDPAPGPATRNPQPATRNPHHRTTAAPTGADTHTARALAGRRPARCAASGGDAALLA